MVWQNMEKMDCIVEHGMFAVLCVVSMFAYSYGMTDAYVVPKWCFTLAVLSVGLIWVSIKWMCNRSCGIRWRFAAWMVVSVCLAQALYGIGQGLGWLPVHSIFRVTGSFENPAGFAACLCAGWPFLLLCRDMLPDKLKNWLPLAVFLLVLAAVLLSGSRSGVMGMTVAVAVWGYGILRIPSKLKRRLFVGGFLVLLGICYFLKKDSADGRLWVWRCSWEMVKEHLWLGQGLQTFRTHYMDYQADFLHAHPDSPFNMLADNVLSPYNEYLGMILNFGFVGFGVFLLVLGGLLYGYHFRRSREGKVALCSLAGIGTFALFSYPLAYPFVWLVLGLDTCILLRPFVSRWLSIYRRCWGGLAFLLCLFVGYKVYERIDAEFRWNRIAYRPTYEHLQTYSDLMSVLGENPYFLYNYAVSLLDMHRLDESLAVALRCKEYSSDYNLELLLGAIYQQRKEYVLAVKCYETAHYMCPSHFQPLYRLCKLYEEAKDEKNLFRLAKMIYEKKAKVFSYEVRHIKREAFRILREVDSLQVQ